MRAGFENFKTVLKNPPKKFPKNSERDFGKKKLRVLFVILAPNYFFRLQSEFFSLAVIFL